MKYKKLKVLFDYFEQRRKLAFDHSELILSKNRLLGGLKLILVFQMQLLKEAKDSKNFLHTMTFKQFRDAISFHSTLH